MSVFCIFFLNDIVIKNNEHMAKEDIIYSKLSGIKKFVSRILALKNRVKIKKSIHLKIFVIEKKNINSIQIKKR